LRVYGLFGTVPPSGTQVLAGLVEQILHGIPEPARSAIVQMAHLPLLRERIVANATGMTGLLALAGHAGLPLRESADGWFELIGPVGIGAQSSTQAMNPRTCYFSYTARQQLKFVPGKSTGKFTGATGPGAYQIRFAAYAPRYSSGKHKGQCDTASNAQPLARGAVSTFLAAGVLTVG
jgi:hypothetical protein